MNASYDCVLALHVWTINGSHLPEKGCYIKSPTAPDATVEYNIDSMIVHTSMNVCYKPIDSLVVTVVSAVPPVGRLLGINVSTPAPSMPST